MERAAKEREEKINLEKKEEERLRLLKKKEEENKAYHIIS